MSTRTIAGHEVEVSDDGFMSRPAQWNRQIAVEIARDSGIDPLTEKHWQVIEFCRSDAAARGEPPGVRRITRKAGVSMKEMYRLFPGGPGLLAAKISGLGKPRGCI